MQIGRAACPSSIYILQLSFCNFHYTRRSLPLPRRPAVYYAGVIDTYRQVIDVLSRCRRVLVTTHVRPDGDALGTVAATILGMRKAGIEAEALLLSRLPNKYEYVFTENAITYHDAEREWPAAVGFERFDALLVMDTGTWSQLPGLQERIGAWKGAKLVVDHHLTQEDWADVKLVVKEAAAAGEIAAELLDTWGIEIDKAIAGALFLAIASDTGWFQYSNTRPYTLRLAARLIEHGVDTDSMYQHLYQNERAERIALQTLAQQSLELLLDGRLAAMRVARGDFGKTSANVGDTESLINIPLQIRTVEVSMLFVEPIEPGPIRVSLRSKGQVDVSKFAEQFGGGGHARAAGLKLETTLQNAHNQAVAAMITTLASTRQGVQQT
jgi:bifunctional oligoribonuclease and PAP phosphatase NrnA